MKQLLLSLAAACSIAPSYAQTSCDLAPATKQGGMLYYGSLGGSIAGGGGRFGNGYINSGLGYQFTDHVTLGVQAGFTHTRIKPLGGGESTNSGFGVGLFGRYTSYLSNRVFVFGQADAGYLRDHIGPFGGNSLGLDIYPGMGIFVARNWALQATVNVLSLRAGDVGPGAYFNLGQGCRFGISKNFGGRHKAAAPKE